MEPAYRERRLLRRGESLWTRLEGLVNRLTTPRYNPFYHLGTLGIFLFLVLLVTGIYLTVFYRPGTDRAYQSVAQMSATWLGSLMRTVHRYASDALMVVVILHILKMLLSDRFWGSRWLAWVSGVFLWVLVWAIGGMGYFLVWDKQAQWMTEFGIYLVKGPIALTFLSSDIAARTFSFFVIILFLHIFLGVLIVLGVLIHVLRLSRARYWAPRWLMVEAAVVLIGLAVWRPAAIRAPANLDTLVGTAVIDAWYLGFIHIVERYGNLPFWGLSLALMGLLTALPWLWKGKSEPGPAMVIEDACTGCTLCSIECPYTAIEMQPRRDESHFKSIAVVHPNLCTSCGICVGACATFANQLPGMPSDALRSALLRAVDAQRAQGVSPVVLVACQRQVTLGTLKGMVEGERYPTTPLHPALLPEGYSPPRLPGPLTPVGVSQLAGANPHPSLPLVTCELPCVGMLPSVWVKELLSAGARDVVVVSCPQEDCAAREGPHWLSERLRRHRALSQEHFHWVEAAPGSADVLRAFLSRLALGKASPATPPAFRSKTPLRWQSVLTGLVLLLLAFGFSLLSEYPIEITSPTEGMLRIVMLHQGKIKEQGMTLSRMQTTLPPGVDPQQVFGGKRFPVSLRLEVDGELLLERTFQPGGLRGEEAIYGFEFQTLPPGTYPLRLWIKDDENGWRMVFEGEVSVGGGQVRTLTYNQQEDLFELR